MQQYAVWQQLQQHYQKIRNVPLRTLFAQDPQRFAHFSRRHLDLLLDFSKNRLTTTTMELLLDVARLAGVDAARTAMFAGERINWTEQRSVLHTALRNRSNTPVWVDGRDVMPEIHATLEQMRLFSDQFRAMTLCGPGGEAFRTLVNIGIGGSHLGPEMITQALQPYAANSPEVRFVTNVDAANFQEGVRSLDPQTTLFVLASKTFTTQETVCNGHRARQWLQQGGIAAPAMDYHFVAVTANVERARAFGVHPDWVFPLWEWVGGRYSWCSAIGLSVAVRLGFDHFAQLLAGAYSLDQHFCEAPLADNMPVLLAMLGIWNRHFLGAETQAIIPYDYSLRRFPAFLQQCDMESNGKQVDRDGQNVTYPTGPILWGEPGSDSQHSFFQLVHQGTHVVPVDFIGCSCSHHVPEEQHLELMAHFFAQSEALMRGRTTEEVLTELQARGLPPEEVHRLLPHRVFPGNQPSNTLLLRKLTPFNLGVLIALYEMKIFVQGVVWRINSFDQWGVELGKILAEQIRGEALALLAGQQVNLSNHDSSTQGLLRQFVQHQKIAS